MIPSLDTLPVGYELPPARICLDQQLVDRFRELTSSRDEPGAEPSLTGLVSVLARWAYLAGCSMPEGTLMLEQQTVLHRPIELGTLTCRARIANRPAGSGRGDIVVETTFEDEARPVAANCVRLRPPRRP